MTERLTAEERVLQAQEARRQGRNLPIDASLSDLSGLHLPAGDLEDANFEGADLTGAVLAGAFLARANLKNAILVGASLDGADLTDADLRGADLAGARIDDAVLANARLEGACLQLVLGDPLSMNGAVLDRMTVERSEFTMRDIAQMVVRGAVVYEAEELPISSTEGQPAPWKPVSSEPGSGADVSEGKVSADVFRIEIPEEPQVPQIALPRGADSDSAPPPSDPLSILPLSGSVSPSSLDQTPSEKLSLELKFDRPLSSFPDIRRALASLPPSSRAQKTPPPSVGSIPPSSLSPSTRSNSILPSIRAAEITARKSSVEPEQEQMPVSQRMFLQLNALIEGARLEVAPVSLRPAAPAVQKLAFDFEFPMPGDEFLGVSIDDELPRGTTSRCFRGKMADGAAAIVRVFDPHCEGAPLQFPAFQRGLRALNKLQSLAEDSLVVEILAVSTDQTAYVVRDYRGQSLKEMVDVSMSLQAGLDAISSLAQTIQKIHECGVLVRSWKPSNVLVDGFDLLVSEPDMVHLSTLAQYRGDAGGYRAYAAPEELLGRGTRSPTADVYALGKMLEFLLTGQEPLVPLGSPPLISQRENIPQVLVDIVKRATASEPQDRYQQVAALLADLHTFQNEGEKAVLQAKIRPEVVSQLSVPPLSTSPELPNIDELIREKLRQKQKVTKDPGALTWHRQAEIGGAIVGGLGGIFILSLMILSPTSVEGLETMAIPMAALVGLVALALPVPTVRRLPYRLATWLAAASLVWLIDPLSLAQFTWGRQLGQGSKEQKEVALENLSRLGKRDAKRARLDGGHYVEMDLANMNFMGASLKDADFTRAFLVEAKFDQADVTAAKFDGANLFGSTLAGAIGLTEASCNRYTKFPEGLTCQNGFIAETAPLKGQPTESAARHQADDPRSVSGDKKGGQRGRKQL